MKVVAFFGLGAMGAPMAKNLLKAGYTIRTCFHPTQNMALVEDIVDLDAFHAFPTNEEAAAGADVIITSMPADAHVKGFLINDSFAAAVKDGAVIVEMSSTKTQTAKDVCAYYEGLGRGIQVIDAPISGGVAGAVNGTLTIFASGDGAALQAVRPVFDAMGKTVFELGPCGEGKTYKNLNNLLLTVNLLAASEAFRIAKKQGLDLDKFLEVVSVSSGGSTALKQRWARMVNDDFAGGFRLALGRKDLGNALELGSDIPTPLAQLTYELMLANAKNDDLDLAAMVKLYD